MSRPRLVARLDDFLDRRLVLVVAPAGYGKTSLLIDFAQSTDLPICWARLSHADQDENRLAQLLAASLAGHFPGLEELIGLDSLTGRPGKALANALADGLDQVVESPVVLIVDDVHRIAEAPAAVSLFNRLIDHAPEPIRFFLSSRRSIGLDLVGLTADGRVGGLGEQELALTRQEVATIVGRNTATMPEQWELDRLHQTTRGWVTGVVLAARSAGERGELRAPATDHAIQRYLRSTVLDRLPESERSFLQAAAVFRQMTANLCDRLLERDDSDRVLEAIVAAGMFTIRLQTNPPAYELHPLLRETLLNLAERDHPERARQQQARAAELLADAGQPEEAFALYAVAGEVERAAELAVEQAAILFESGRIATLERWVEQLQAWRASAAPAYLYMADACADRGHADDAERWIAAALDTLDGRALKVAQATAESIRGRLADKQGDPDRLQVHAENRARLLGQRAKPRQRAITHRMQARALLRQNSQLEKAEANARKAIALFRKSGDPYLEAQAWLDLSAVLTAAGHPDEAASAVQDALELLPPSGRLIPRSTGLNNQAVLLHHAGRFEQSLELFNEARRIARRGASPFHEASALFGQADLFADLGLQFQAADLYDEAVRLSQTIESTRLVHYGYTQTSQLHRRSGTLSLAMTWLERAVELCGETDEVRIGRIALLTESDPKVALREIEVQHRDNGALSREHKTALDYFRARAAYRLGEEDGPMQETCLDNASRLRTEQVIAGELAYDRDARTRLIEATSHPTAAKLEIRLRHMEALASRYRADTATASPSGLHVNALGDSRIFLDGSPIESLAPLPRQLLFFLIDRRSIERDRLLEWFWPESSNDKQVSNLYTAMHAIRRGIGADIIDIDGSTYQVNRGLPLAYDVHDFERALAGIGSRPAGDPQRFYLAQLGLRAYAGDFLPAFDSEWVITRRSALAADHLKLLLIHADEATLHAEPRMALSSVMAAWEIDPLRDDVVLKLLELLASLNRRTEAAGVYQRHVQRMRDELGLEPTKALQEAYARILNL